MKSGVPRGREHAPDGTLSTAEVTALFDVDVDTIAGWVADGRLTCRRDIFGRRRFFNLEVQRRLEDPMGMLFPTTT